MIIFIAIILLSFLLCLIINRYTNSMLQQLLGMFAVIGITVYSGLGISLETVPNRYLVSFVIFILTFTVSYLFFLKRTNNNRKSVNLNNPALNIFQLNRISKIGFYVYFFTLFIFLIYPENRLLLLVSPPRMNIQGIAQLNNYYKSNQILYLTGLISVFCKPFFYIYLYNLWTQKKNLLILCFITLDVYLTALKFEYIGRTDIVIALMMLLLIMAYQNNKKIKLGTSGMILSILVCCIPLLMEYVYVRAGYSWDLTDIKSLFSIFLGTEGYYPIYYDVILKNHITVSPIDYLIWLFTLPLPKMLVPSLKITEINYLFSSLISGLSLSDIGFSYSLPSILGEAFIVWGGWFFWVHAVLLGAISALTVKIFERYPQLHFYVLFISMRAFALGRGGSQGYISTIVNSSILLILYLLFVNLMYFRRKRVRVLYKFV